MEQKFLHGQDLGFHSTLRDAEGNVLDLYTGAFDLKSSQPDIPALTADWEKKIKAVPIQMGPTVPTSRAANNSSPPWG